MKTIKSPQSIPTPEPVPPKPEMAGPNVATIPLVYASQMALTAALRSANAGDACTRENEMVSKIPQIISETAFFICPLPMLRGGGFTLIPLGYLPQVFPPNTCGIFPRSCSGLYLMPYSDFAGGRGWPTPWSPGYTFVQGSHRSPHPAIRQRLQVRSAYPWRVHFDHCAGNGPVGCPPGDRRLHHDDPAAGRLEAQDPQFLLIEGHHFLLSDHDQHPIDVQQSHPSGLHLAPGHVRTAVCEIPALKADYSPSHRHGTSVPLVGLAPDVRCNHSSLAGAASRSHHGRIDNGDHRALRPRAQQRLQQHRPVARSASAHVIRGIDQDDRPVCHPQSLRNGLIRRHLRDTELVSAVPQNPREVTSNASSEIGRGVRGHDDAAAGARHVGVRKPGGHDDIYNGRIALLVVGAAHHLCHRPRGRPLRLRRDQEGRVSGGPRLLYLTVAPGPQRVAGRNLPGLL